MKEGRDRLGRFIVGNGGGPGRPKRATEADYFRALSSIISVEDLRVIARRAVADAKRGSARAREWVCKFLLGDPDPKAPSSTECRKRGLQLLQAVCEAMSQEPVDTRPAGEDRLPKGTAAVNSVAPAQHGGATPLQSEEQQ